MTTYTHISDLAMETQPPDKGILSRTLCNDDRLKAVLFGFAQGEELSEHTASMPAVLHFLKGEAKLTLGDATDGGWAGHMGPYAQGLAPQHSGQNPVGHAVAAAEVKAATCERMNGLLVCPRPRFAWDRALQCRAGFP